MADLTAVLQGTQNPDVTIRKQAEDHLESRAKSDRAGLMAGLVAELAAEDKDVAVRMMAGLYVKNLLDAKDLTLQNEKTALWLAMPPQQKGHIKHVATQVLSSPVPQTRHTAAQLVAKIGSIELVQTAAENQWPELLPSLVQQVSGGANDCVKHASLECLGYLCEDLPEGCVGPEMANQMLTAIVGGMGKDKPNELRLAAVVALRNSLTFASQNMERDNERDVIMQVICEATQCEEVKVKVAAYECIARVANLFYEKLQPYMEAFFRLTTSCIAQGPEEVALQALEFWSTLCDVELEIMAEVEDMGEDADAELLQRSKNYIQAGLGSLVPMLLQAMSKQEEEQEADSWNLSMAAATCLGLVALVVSDQVVAPVMAFVQENLQSSDWHLCEAAIMAFGSVLDGPTSEGLSAYVAQGLPMMLNFLQPNVQVMIQDTAAWTIGRICELHPDTVTEQQLRPLTEALFQALDRPARVAHNVAYAIHNLAQRFQPEDEAPATTPLSFCFSAMVEKLMKMTDREDAGEHNLRTSCFEAANMLVQACGNDCLPTLQAMTLGVLQRLEATFAAQPLSNEEKTQLYQTQSLLCGMVQALVTRIGKPVESVADRIMTALLHVFSSDHSTCHIEAFLAVGAVAMALDDAFAKYLAALKDPLVKGLRAHQSFHLCTVAIGVVGDCCRAVGKAIQPFSDELVTCVMELLQNQSVHRQVKPQAIAVLSDVAMALEDQFGRYLGALMPILVQAGTFVPPPGDEELQDFANELREALLEAFTGFIQGPDMNVATLLGPYAAGLMSLLQLVEADEMASESVLCNAVGLIGDLALKVGAGAVAMLSQPFVASLIRQAEAPDVSDRCHEQAAWVKQTLQRMGVPGV